MAAQGGALMMTYPAAADDPDIQSWGRGSALDAGLLLNLGTVTRPSQPQYVVVTTSTREAELIADVNALSAEVARLARVVDGIRQQLAIPVSVAREMSKPDAKAEVAAYLQGQGRAFPSDISEALGLDYDMVVEVLDDLSRDGRIEFETTESAGNAS